MNSSDYDPDYADVPDEPEYARIVDTEYSVVNKLNNKSPDEETIVVIDNASSLIRTPPPSAAAPGADALRSPMSAKGHRKINSLDRPVKPPRHSVMESLNLTTGSLENNHNYQNSSTTRIKKLNLSSTSASASAADEQRQPSRPPLPSKENIEKHSSMITSRHSINLKVNPNSDKVSVNNDMTKSLPIYNHGATNVEVEPADDEDDVGDIDVADSRHQNDFGHHQNNKQAPIIAFRRNMFENNNGVEPADKEKFTANNRSSTKKKSSNSSEEKSPTTNDAPPSRPKPPVPSKPSKTDDNMTRL